jgi:phospholipid/cholesterol/gamma-HCH transport system ATP-binding protein
MNILQTELKHTKTLDKNDDPIIDVSHLRLSFGNEEVLNDLSMQLFNGENLVVLGKSGSGKSVLIKCIVRLLKSDSGTIEIFGNNINNLDRSGLGDLRKKIGFLFQSGAIYDSMTVKENLEFPLRRINRDLSQKEIDLKINEALENVGLADAINKMPSQLSGGMRKRISLARTIVVAPMIMLYDEPTTGLDPITSEEISTLINDIKSKYKTSSIIITHDIECARATADRILMIKDGKIYMEGDLETFENSDDLYIKSFFRQKKSENNMHN